MFVSELNTYPIKSMKGISLDHASVEDRGLEYDRRWMLVDEDGKFLTQREYPRMATIRIDLAGGRLVATPDGRGPITISPLPSDSPERRVKIWSSNVRALVYHDEVNQCFSEYLGAECRLVFMPESTRRKVNPVFAVRKFRDTVSFADGYPCLLIGEASLAELNSRLADPVPMDRFRPNIVVSGADAFAEDGWKQIRIGDTIFHVVKPCARCVITTIDQEKGVKTGTDPLKTLATFRSKGKNVLFGQNLIADSSGSTIKVGDHVDVI